MAQDFSDPQAVASSSEKKRPRFTYTIPEECRLLADDPTTVTLIPVTIDEEMQAVKAARDLKGTTIDRELLKFSLVAANDRPLDWALGQRDVVIETVSAPVRQLLYEAWGQINTPKKEAVASFLASRKASL